MVLAVLLAVPLGLVPGARAQQGSVATDKAALEALYAATGGATWKDNTNWSSAEPLSSWHGVSTDEDGRVTRLDLWDNGLDGTLPTDLENLARLESLQLARNYALTGTLPSGVRELSDLETVGIDRTELCVADDTTLEAWLEKVSFTGLVCPPAEQSVIDVAVFYTPLARARAGGTDEIETTIDLMAAETNQAYRTSGVHQRIRLAAVEEVVGYTESSKSWNDLLRLRKPSDGRMDEVHEIRDMVAADIVLLVRAGGGSRAYRIFTPPQDFASQAFGVVRSGNGGALAHELGHIMGLRHDRHVQCGGSCYTVTRFPYAFGYVNQRAFDPNDPESPNPDPTVPATARWRTIMSYNRQCAAAGFGCQWLFRFSNPDQLYPNPGSDPLGHAGLEPAPRANGPSDAVRMLNRTRGYVANFRSAPDITVSVATSTTPVTEGTAVTYTVTLDQAAREALTVAVSVTESGSVLSGTPPASVAFAKGATSATLSVPTAADSVVEADSTVTATVTEGTGYAIGTGASASVTVEDDDLATFTVSADPAAIREGESATLTVAISNGVTFAQAQTILLATSGTASAADYTDVPTTLTLAAGASSVTATLTAAADQEEEQAETVTVTASHGASAIGSATVTINSISHDTTLDTLSLSGIDIGTFSAEVAAYTASVANSVTATTVTATPAHSAATVTIEPDPQVAQWHLLCEFCTFT